MIYPRIFPYNASIFSIIVSDLNCFAVSLAANAKRCLRAVSLSKSFIFSSASSIVLTIKPFSPLRIISGATPTEKLIGTNHCDIASIKLSENPS